jgi:cell wall-associated NlpC family hydrolase
MPTRAQFLDEARAYIGTPYRLQGRTKGRTTAGVDCAGIFLGACQAFGLVDRCGVPLTLSDYATYTRDVNAIALFRPRLFEKKLADLRPADMIVFNFPIAGLPAGARGGLRNVRESPCHVAVAGELFGSLSVIQAYQGVERVVEHTLDGKWRRRIAAVFSIPGVED